MNTTDARTEKKKQVKKNIMVGIKRIMTIDLHYDGSALSCNPGLQYPHLHGPVYTPDNNRWDTPPV